MKNDLIVEEKEHVAPRTPAEELITEIYASIVNVAPLGVFDNLTTLTMPQATRVRQCLQLIFHVDIPIDRLLLYTTINNLVDFLSEVWGGREIVEEIAWTFSQIEKLSEDEVKLQLVNELSMSNLGLGEAT